MLPLLQLAMAEYGPWLTVTALVDTLVVLGVSAALQAALPDGT